MDRRCDICGKTCPEHKMIKVFTGRTLWRCWECYKKGHGEVTGLETQTIKRRIKEMNKK